MYDTIEKTPVNAEPCVAELPSVGLVVRRIHEQAAACGQRAEVLLQLVSGDTVPPCCPDEPRSMREDLMQTFDLLNRLEGMLETLCGVLGT